MGRLEVTAWHQSTALGTPCGAGSPDSHGPAPIDRTNGGGSGNGTTGTYPLGGGAHRARLALPVGLSRQALWPGPGDAGRQVVAGRGLTDPGLPQRRDGRPAERHLPEHGRRGLGRRAVHVRAARPGHRPHPGHRHAPCGLWRRTLDAAALVVAPAAGPEPAHRRSHHLCAHAAGARGIAGGRHLGPGPLDQAAVPAAWEPPLLLSAGICRPSRRPRRRPSREWRRSSSELRNEPILRRPPLHRAAFAARQSSWNPPTSSSAAPSSTT